jgi:5-methylcytosine-specific restriction endonuclease McrA
MRAHSLPDHAVLPALAILVARDRSTTVEMLDHIAVADARGLHRPEGYRSMFEYCVRVLNMSEDSAYKRIRAARAARDFPAIFYMLADGRLHLSGVTLLARFLRAVDEPQELLAAAVHKTNRQIEHMLAERFPQPDLPAKIRPIGASGHRLTAATDPVAERASSPTGTSGVGVVVPELLAAATDVTSSEQLAARPVLFDDTQRACTERADLGSVDANPNREPLPAPAHVDAPPQVVPAPAIQPPTVVPAPQRFSLQLTMSQDMHDDLRAVQALLSHQIPTGDVVEVLHRSLKMARRELEKHKFAMTDKPRAGHSNSGSNPRHVPANVRRSVRARDGDRCTFVSEAGYRCDARTSLEYDHIEPVARGGISTVENLRLLCRAHNQLEAERAFGAGFMENKRGPVPRNAESTG